MAPQQQQAPVRIVHDGSGGLVGETHDVVLEPVLARDLDVDEYEADPVALVDRSLTVHRPAHASNLR